MHSVVLISLDPHQLPTQEKEKENSHQMAQVILRATYWHAYVEPINCGKFYSAVLTILQFKCPKREISGSGKYEAHLLFTNFETTLNLLCALNIYQGKTLCQC